MPAPTSTPDPTESTPLSPSTSHPTQNYQTHHEEDSDPSSSSDSGGGYISGSGRRESILDRPQRKSSRITIATRTNSDQGNPLANSIQWASLDANTARTSSPGISVSPRMNASSVDARNQQLPVPTSGNLLSEPSFGESRRRRSREGSNTKLSPAATGRKKSRQHSREGGERSNRGVFSWFHGLAEKYGAIELDNKGSVARDHLALERTFLAWLRTSLAFASIGIGITQLFRLNTTLNSGDPHIEPPSTTPIFRLRKVGKPLGTTFLGISIVILCLGWRRYFESQYWIIRGKFPASRGSVFLVTFVAATLIVVSLVVVVIVGNGM